MGQSIEEIYDKLEKISQLEGSEVGETIAGLLNLYGYAPYLDDGFFKYLEAEIRRWGVWADECTRIVERTETYTKTWEEVEITGYFG